MDRGAPGTTVPGPDPSTGATSSRLSTDTATTRAGPVRPNDADAMTELARFRLRTEQDLLALVPHTLGFHPEESLVLVALDRRGRPVCGRVDLPDAPSDLPVCLEQLLVAADQHRAETALVVAYSTDAVLADEAGGLLVLALGAQGIRVVCGIRADGERWYPLEVAVRDRDDLLLADGEAYDVRAHPFTAQSVVDGHVTLGSRGELQATLEPDPVLVAQVEAAASRVGALPRRHTRLVREGAWLRRTVASLASHRRGHLSEVGSDWSPHAAARAIRDLRHQDLRDLVWCDLTRAAAEAHAEVWRSLLRRTPEADAAPVAAVLAFASWLGGHGALAWCAVERARAQEPDNVLADLVAQALDGALPPSSWIPMDPRTFPLSAG
jgi:hypothetical protein